MDAERFVASSPSSAGNRWPVTVIGGWIGGLVAAIRCAEQDVPVTLHEARSQLGGRARSTGPPFVANDGPHGLYADGITWRFLLDRQVAVPGGQTAGGWLPVPCGRKDPTHAAAGDATGVPRDAPPGAGGK